MVMSRRSWLVALAGGIGLLLGAALLVLFQLRGSAANSQERMLDALTRQAELLATQTGESAVQPTVMPDNTSTPAVPTATTADSPGFRLWIDDDLPITVDGASTLPIHVTTLDAQHVGSTIVFVVYGGGQVDPLQVRLPALGETVDVVYVSGRATTDVRVEAVLNDSGQRASLVIRTEADHFQIVGLPGTPQPLLNNPNSITIPVELSLESTVNRPLKGSYQVELEVVGGLISPIQDGDSGLTRLTIPLSATTRVATLYFIPSADVTSGQLQARIPEREDVRPLDLPIYWQNTASSLRFIMPTSNRQMPFLWQQENNFCVRTRDAFNQPMTANVLQVRYTPVFDGTGLNGQPAALSFSTVLAQPGEWVSTASGRMPVFVDSASLSQCFQARLPGGNSGVVQLEAATENPQVRDSVYALLYYRPVYLSGVGLPLSLTLASDDTTETAPVLVLPPGYAVYGYSLAPEHETSQLLVLMLWAEPDAIDETGSLRIVPGSGTLTLYVEQQWPVQVIGGIPRAFVAPAELGSAMRRVFVAVYAP
jgi:hypothetical protein